MSRSLLISDLHLTPGRPDLTRALGHFLTENRDCDALYILGDLFEAWIGDDDDAPLAAQVRELLAHFSATGPALYLMQGNRDFLLGEGFCASAGGQLLPDPSVVDLQGQRVLLMHGDSLCTADADYQAFRRTARDPAWQAQVLGQSLEERRQLAGQLRGMSQEANSNKAEDIMDVTPDEVDRALRAHGVDCLIHGHTHRPARHDHAQGQRWVLGDWDEKGWAIEVQGAGIKLFNFHINQ